MRRLPILCARAPRRAYFGTSAAPAVGDAAALPERGGIDADAAARGALDDRERHAEHVDRLVRAPAQLPLARAEVPDPVVARVDEAARPVVLQGVELAQLAVAVDLEARLLQSSGGAPVHAGECLATCDLPALVVRVVVRAQVEVDREG